MFIIHINGMPGVGKFTVAKILANKISAKLIDNHLIVDLAEAICGGRTSAYMQTFDDIAGQTYEMLCKQSDGKNIVFTNALAKGLAEDEQRLKAVREFAITIKGIFIPVFLKCDEQENLARAINPSRKNKGKLTNPEQLKKIRADYEVAHDETHPNGIIIDNTRLAADQTATTILEHLKKL